MHKQRLLDKQFVRRMRIQAKSKDPAKAEEARQGLALREASIAAQSGASSRDNSVSASHASLTTLLQHFIAGSPSHCDRRAHVKRVIATTEAELLNGMQLSLIHI